MSYYQLSNLFCKMAPNTIVCELCGLNSDSFSSRKMFKKYYEKHQEGKYECPQCFKMFSTPSTLYQHKQDVHNKPLKCDCCGKSFSKKSNLQRHLQMKEKLMVTPDKSKEDSKVECPHCNKYYNSVKFYNIPPG